MRLASVLLLSVLVAPLALAQDSTKGPGMEGLRFVDARDGAAFEIPAEFVFDAFTQAQRYGHLPPGVRALALMKPNMTAQLQLVVIASPRIKLDSLSWVDKIEAGLRSDDTAGYHEVRDRVSHWSRDSMSYRFVDYNTQLRQYRIGACKAATVDHPVPVMICAYMRTPKAEDYGDLLNRITVTRAGSSAPAKAPDQP